MEALHELKGVMKNLGTALEIAEGDRHEPDLFFAHRAIQAAPATARRPVAGWPRGLPSWIERGPDGEPYCLWYRDGRSKQAGVPDPGTHVLLTRRYS